jgi:hypothetical protein
MGVVASRGEQCTGGVIMKRHIIGTLIIGVLVATYGIEQSAAEVHNPRIQRGVMQFDEPVQLLNETLKGQYLFLHHEGMRERGKPCIFVYRNNLGGFVLSFHCRAVKRERAERFKIVFASSEASNLPVIAEIQFAGRIEGHQVP